MPKFPKAFQRRKSTANALEDLENQPPVAEPSFKVLERSTGGGTSFDGGIKLSKAAPGRPLTSPRHKEDNIFEDIKGNRGSGASNTNTISTTDNSSRLSAASTAASSTNDPHPSEDWRSPHDKPFHDIPPPRVPRSSSGFSLKHAGRTLSWGRSKPSPTPSPPIRNVEQDKSPLESHAVGENGSYGRDRAVTASSYASTATPPKLEEKDMAMDLGGDFSNMFSGFEQRKSVVMEAQNMREMSSSPEYAPARPPATRSYSSGRLNQPSPLHIDRHKQIEPSPYSWSSHHSNDGLISNPSPPTPGPPPVPKHSSPSRDTLPSTARPQRPGGITDTSLRRSSALSAKRQSTLEYDDGNDEDARLLRESVNASRRMDDSPVNVRDSWAMASTSASYNLQNTENSSGGPGSAVPTPKANTLQPDIHEDNMFDEDIIEDASVALAFNEKPRSPPPVQRTSQHKVMTPQQFERYKQDQERLRSVGGVSKDDEEDEEPYDDEEDEAEKRRELAKQRRKQEAHMAVYRQQMMKVTGESPSTPRPGVFATQSSPNLLVNGNPEEGEEEDEEVPLAILQAHGFPSKHRPPTQLSSMGSNPNLRAASQMGGGGNLPVFARNLPQDPYIGAGLVHPSQRETLAFGAGSVHGGSTRGTPTPGGLVGVIATEERSRAMRRGSPNPDGQYAPMPSNLMHGMAPMGRNSGGSMMGGMGPSGPMMLTPGDQAQIEMSQQMQQFMQMQMQFMQMMTAGQGQPQQNGHLSQPPVIPRPSSAQGSNLLRPESSHQRTMSMLDSKPAPWMQGGPMFTPSPHVQGAGYAPSIAPSERSNIGLPGRYRPVTHVPAAEKSRASTMSGALQGWETKTGTSTIKAVQKPTNVSDDEDEEGWAEMKKKREKKRSLWKHKKDDTNGFKDILTYTAQ